MKIIDHICPYCNKEFKIAENTISAICPNCGQPVSVKPPQDYKKIQEQTPPIVNQEEVLTQPEQIDSVPKNTYTPPQYQQQQYQNPNQQPQYQPPQYQQQQQQYQNPNQPPQYQQQQYQNPNQPPQYQPPQYQNANQPPQYQPPQYQQQQYQNPNQPPLYNRPIKENKFKTFINKKFVPFFTSIPSKIKKSKKQKQEPEKIKKDKKELPPKMSNMKHFITILVTFFLVLSIINTLFLMFLHSVSSDKSLDKIAQDLDLSKLNIVVYNENTKKDEDLSLSEFLEYYCQTWGIRLTENDFDDIFSDKNKFVNEFLILNVKEYRDYFTGKNDEASLSIKEINAFLSISLKKINTITGKSITKEEQALITNELNEMIDFNSFSTNSLEGRMNTSLIRFYLSSKTLTISIIITILLLTLSFIISPIHILKNIKRNGIIAIIFGVLFIVNAISFKVASDIIANLINTSSKFTDVLMNPFISSALSIGVSLLIIGLIMLFTSLIIKKLFFIENKGLKVNESTLVNIEI